jgi:hypothetical protein
MPMIICGRLEEQHTQTQALAILKNNSLDS